MLSWNDQQGHLGFAMTLTARDRGDWSAHGGDIPPSSGPARLGAPMMA